MKRTRQKLGKAESSFDAYLRGELNDAEYRRYFNAAGEELQLAYTLQKQLKALRESKGLSQKDIAALLGMKSPAVSRLEQEDYLPRLTLQNLIRYANACHVKVNIRFAPIRKHRKAG